jgi:hypothetical protein
MIMNLKIKVRSDNIQNMNKSIRGLTSSNAFSRMITDQSRKSTSLTVIKALNSKHGPTIKVTIKNKKLIPRNIQDWYTPFYSKRLTSKITAKVLEKPIIL